MAETLVHPKYIISIVYLCRHTVDATKLIECVREKC